MNLVGPDWGEHRSSGSLTNPGKARQSTSLTLAAENRNRFVFLETHPAICVWNIVNANAIVGVGGTNMYKANSIFP